MLTYMPSSKPVTSGRNSRRRQLVIDGITALFVLLWIYAAVSKLMDYETFRLQLGKSPMLTSFAPVVTWAIPAMEILTAMLLLFGKTRFTGLYASLLLMTIFTAYIITMLDFSSYVPCSCGGVLEKLSWTQHIYFNLAFVLLAIAGILLEVKHHGRSTGIGVYKPGAG